MTTAELLDDVKREFGRRKFVAGLFIAFVRFLRALNAFGGTYPNLDAFFRSFPQQSQTSQGARANTLIVRVARGDSSSTLSIRPFYNEAERVIRAEKKRFDYPNCAPHATQAWSDYRRWLEALLPRTAEEAAALETSVLDFVLSALPSHEIDPATVRPVERRFTRLLQEFDFSSHRGEPAGAAFQGVAYAYFRADAPHLHLDVAKVGAGSRRLQRVGDIDGWEGERLILSAEVKYYHATTALLSALANFQSEVTRRGALGIVVASTYDPDARTGVEDLGLRTLDQDDLIRIVDLWDPLKQRAAVAAFTYYVHHIEKRMPLIRRLSEFLAALDRPGV